MDGNLLQRRKRRAMYFPPVLEWAGRKDKVKCQQSHMYTHEWEKTSPDNEQTQNRIMTMERCVSDRGWSCAPCSLNWHKKDKGGEGKGGGRGLLTIDSSKQTHNGAWKGIVGTKEGPKEEEKGGIVFFLRTTTKITNACSQRPSHRTIPSTDRKEGWVYCHFVSLSLVHSTIRSMDKKKEGTDTQKKSSRCEEVQ